jgi:hypothetical protein
VKSRTGRPESALHQERNRGNQSAGRLRAVPNSRSASFMLLAPPERLRSSPQLGDGITIVPRAKAFGNTIQVFAEAVPCSLPVIDSHES